MPLVGERVIFDVAEKDGKIHAMNVTAPGGHYIEGSSETISDRVEFRPFMKKMHDQGQRLHLQD